MVAAVQGGVHAMLKDAPMSESDSVQVSKREVTGVHNGVQMVTVGNVHTSPYPVLPDAMPLATQRRGHKPTQILELRRLLPLTFVKVSIHYIEKTTAAPEACHWPLFLPSTVSPFTYKRSFCSLGIPRLHVKTSSGGL